MEGEWISLFPRFQLHIRGVGKLCKSQRAFVSKFCSYARKLACTVRQWQSPTSRRHEPVFLIWTVSSSLEMFISKFKQIKNCFKYLWWCQSGGAKDLRGIHFNSSPSHGCLCSILHTAEQSAKECVAAPSHPTLHGATCERLFLNWAEIQLTVTLLFGSIFATRNQIGHTLSTWIQEIDQTLESDIDVVLSLPFTPNGTVTSYISICLLMGEN